MYEDSRWLIYRVDQKNMGIDLTIDCNPFHQICHITTWTCRWLGYKY